MKYLFCVYDDGSQAKRPSISERETFRETFRDIFDGACLANEAALRESGYLIATAVPVVSRLRFRVRWWAKNVWRDTAVKPPG